MTATAGTDQETAIELMPKRRWGTYGAAGIVLVLVAALVRAVVTDKRFEWGVIGHYLFHGTVMKGLLVTLELTVISMAIGIVLGIVLALMRMSSNPVLGGVSRFYIWAFRGVPLLVQLLIWFNLASLFPRLGLGIPFGPLVVSASSNVIIGTYTAALLGLGLHEAAYMAEIIRAGVISVDAGQHDAAAALGMSKRMSMRRVVLPQAMRVIIPPTGNEVISMVKSTSIVSVISLAELLYSVQIIYSQNFQTIPLLMVASIWYLAIIGILSLLQAQLERRCARGRNRRAGGFGLRRLFAPRGDQPAQVLESLDRSSL